MQKNHLHELSIGQLIGLCIIFIAISSVVTFFFTILTKSGIPIDGYIVLAISQVIYWPVVIYFGLQMANCSWRRAFPLKRFPFYIIPALLIATYGFAVISLAIKFLIPGFKSWMETMHTSYAGSNYLLMIFPLVIVGPILEELFFRGLILRGLLSRYSTKKSILISSLFFAIVHFTPWQFVFAFIVGIVLAWVYIKTGSLLPSMLIHATLNFSANFLIRPLSAILGYNMETIKTIGQLPFSMVVVAFILFALGGSVFWRQVSRLEQLPKEYLALRGPSIINQEQDIQEQIKAAQQINSAENQGGANVPD